MELLLTQEINVTSKGCSVIHRGGDKRRGNIPIRYTAMASYSGTATSKYATGYTVTADYKGDVTRTSCDTVIYTAIFYSTGRAEVLPKTGSFNWMWVLAPLGVLALGGCGYAGYKGYKHYLNKKRGYE